MNPYVWISFIVIAYTICTITQKICQHRRYNTEDTSNTVCEIYMNQMCVLYKTGTWVRIEPSSVGFFIQSIFPLKIYKFSPNKFVLLSFFYRTETKMDFLLQALLLRQTVVSSSTHYCVFTVPTQTLVDFFFLFDSNRVIKGRGLKEVTIRHF